MKFEGGVARWGSAGALYALHTAGINSEHHNWLPSRVLTRCTAGDGICAPPTCSPVKDSAVKDST